MSRVFIGLLVWTVLPRLAAQHGLKTGPSTKPLHTSSDEKFNIKRRLTNKFDKPSSVRLKSDSLGDYFSLYKCNPIKGSCDLNVYKIFSDDQLSDRLRRTYEVWNFVDIHDTRGKCGAQRLSKRNEEFEQEQDRESVARSKARYTKLVDSPENKPYVLDDDYSLVNYIDNWKGLDPDHKLRRFHRKSEKTQKSQTRLQKRDLEDKQFQVEFHNWKKDNEFTGKLSSSYESVNEGKRKSLIQHRKVKGHYRTKCDRNRGYIDPGSHHFKTKIRYTPRKKKRLLWGRKRAKVYPKLGPKGSEFLDELESKSWENTAAMGHAWHWATTRSYVMGALTPRKEFATPNSQPMGMMPQIFVPVMNLSDSLARQPFVAKVDQPKIQHAPFQNIVSAQKPMQNHSNSLLQIGLPPHSDVALALRPVLNQNRASSNGKSPTRRPSIYFNLPTEFINPYENHYENFKNTPFWNAWQGPPGFRKVVGNPVRLSYFQRFTITPNMRNEQLLNPSLALPSVFDNHHEEPGRNKFNGSCIVQNINVSPIAKHESAPLKQPPKVLETADIVNLLQSALLPQNPQIPQVAPTTQETHGAVSKSIPMDRMLEIIAPSESTLIAMSRPLTQKCCENATATENAVHSVKEDSELIVDATKEALLSLFTTEEPMMESLEDILRRNTDRKIPIVYDIEDAPQLAAQRSIEVTENPNKNGSLCQNVNERKHHALHRRGILKKNKTSIKHKTVQKMNSSNATLTTPWIVLATTENMLYSEIMEMQRRKLNHTRKSKTLKPTSKSKINLLFKNKVKPNDTKIDPPTSTNEPKVKRKRDQNSVEGRRQGKPPNEPVPSELRCGKCTCGCHPTQRTTQCCRCREQPLELTTKRSCEPASLSRGSISCPDCHQEFTYQLGLRSLISS